MRAVSRLSINALLGRRSRTALLIGAVALSTALVAAIACALSSLNEGMSFKLANTVGRADLIVREVSGDRFTTNVLTRLRERPEVLVSAPRTREPVFLRARDGDEPTLASLQGIDPAVEYQVVTGEVDFGRRVGADGEIVLDRQTAESLGVEIGGEVLAGDGERRRALRLVGVVAPRTIEIINRPSGFVTIPTLHQITGRIGTLHEVQVILRDGVDSTEMVDRLTAALPTGMLIRESELVTSGLQGRMRANKILFVTAAGLAYIAAAFIVLTGLTTSVLERQRELAVLRCIGANRLQLAVMQMLVGGVIGIGGAVVGVPLGIFLAWMMTVIFPERLPAGLFMPVVGLLAAAGGSVLAGLIGAIWPSINASRTKPLVAMASRAKPVRRRGIAVVTVAAIIGIGSQYVIVSRVENLDALFWAYTAVGLPAMFIGYFLLGVPLIALLSRTLAPVLSRLLGLPGRLLGSTVGATPYRNGFTAGALMVGLSMMVSVWTNGNAVLRDWFDTIRFPDAFATGVFGGIKITPEARARVDALPFVSQTAAITLIDIETRAFSLIRGIRGPGTTFIAFEVDPFFEMTNLYWVQGTPEEAIPKLRDGTGVLVAQEFLVQREGFSIGHMFPITYLGRTKEFEIVGAVSSPGLDVVRRYFDFEEEYARNSIHAVFGSRDVLRELFRTDAIDMLQIALTGDISDEEAAEKLRETIGIPGVVTGSGREIKQNIVDIGRGSMRIATIVAIATMLIGCAGVANIVIAGIDARRYEFGVLRSVGMGRSALARLVLGEVVIVAVCGAVLGTMLGLQSAWAGQRISSLVAGIELRLRPPLDAVSLGWAILIGLTVLSVLPIVLSVSRLKIRELLQTTRG